MLYKSCSRDDLCGYLAKKGVTSPRRIAGWQLFGSRNPIVSFVDRNFRCVSVGEGYLGHNRASETPRVVGPRSGRYTPGWSERAVPPDPDRTVVIVDKRSCDHIAWRSCDQWHMLELAASGKWSLW